MMQRGINRESCKREQTQGLGWRFAWSTSNRLFARLQFVVSGTRMCMVPCLHHRAETLEQRASGAEASSTETWGLGIPLGPEMQGN